MRGDLCVFLDRELSEKKRDDPRTEKLGDVLFSIFAFLPIGNFWHRHLENEWVSE